MLFSWVTVALAGNLSIGVGGGIAKDMGDPSLGDEKYANFDLGLGLLVPVRYKVGDTTRLRFDLGLQMARGDDRVTFEQDGTRYYLDDQPAAVTAATLSVGGDLFLGKTPVYLGATMGGGYFLVAHSFSGGPSDLGKDAASHQLAPVADIHLGGYQEVGDTLAFWLESGYSISFLDVSALDTAGLNAQRAPFGWNALRVGLGVSLSL
jgi:hypothetical protein